VPRLKQTDMLEVAGGGVSLGFTNPSRGENPKVSSRVLKAITHIPKT
jgi:hypothetical protein